MLNVLNASITVKYIIKLIFKKKGNDIMKTTITKEEIKNAMNRYISECKWGYDSDDYYNEYDYETTDYGLSRITDTFLKNKANLISLFEKSPHYNGKYQIVLDNESYTREMDRETICGFFSYLHNIVEIPYRFDEKIFSEWKGFYALRYDRWSDYYILYAIMGEIENGDIIGMEVATASNYPHLYSVENRGYYYTERLKCNHTTLITLTDFYDRFKDGTIGYAPNVNKEILFAKEDRENYNPIMTELFRQEEAVNILRDYTLTINDGLMDESIAKRINALFPSLRATAGQKVSRFVNKLCTKIIKIEKGKGSEYEKRFAAFADAINPLEVVRWTILSIHPVDFLAMSNGDNWSSCHTINQISEVGDNYHGCYGSGTLSYMMDESSFVFYTITKKYDGNEFEFEPKINRCMFHYGYDKLIQGRVYPQDNDGINAVYDKIRPIVQRVITEALDVSNLWRNSKGTSVCAEASNQTGTHYSDITCFETCNVSYYGSSTSGIEKNPVKIKIGHSPICPCCGNIHWENNNIMCQGCQEEIADIAICDRCGRRINAEEAIYDVDTGFRYCDYECAEDDNCYYCSNVDEYHSVDVYWDDYDEEYFYDPYNDHIETRHGCYCFRNEENAIEAGFVYDEEKDDWVQED